MSVSDALARAREVAARLTAAALNKNEGEDAEATGKRKNRGWGEEAQHPVGTAGEVTKKIVLPPNTSEINFSTLVIGPKGANHRHLVESSGVQRMVIRGKGASSAGNDAEEDPYVLLSGTAEAVEKASEQLHKLFNDPQEALRLKDAQLRNLADEKNNNDGGAATTNSGGGIGFQMRVPNHLVGFVIGKGGENIHRMQSLSGGRVQIQKEMDMQPNETHRIVTLTGTNEAVEDMKQRIEEIIRNRTGGGFDAAANGGGGVGGRDARPMASSSARLDQMAVVYKVPVPGDRIGLIIGKGGSTIKQIQDRTRTVVQIPNDADADNPTVRTISIGGDSHEACLAAQQEIQQAIIPQQHQQGPSSSASANTTIFVPIPDERAGGVIGKGGCTIKELQARLRVKVTVPPQPEPNSHPPMRMAQVSGAPEAVQHARVEIERMIANAVPGLTRGFNNGGGGGGGGFGQQHNPHHQQAASYGSGGAEGHSAYLHQQYQHQQPQVPAQHHYQQDHHQHQQQQQQQQEQQEQQEGAVDLTQYYGEFWNYAMHYGERAARLYYAAWSPPEGTSPPPGVVIAPDIELDAAAAPAAVAASDSTAPAATAEAEAEATGAGEEATKVEAQLSAEVLAYRAQYKAWWDMHGKAAGAPEVPPE